MPFLEPEIVFGKWIEVDGNQGTEFIDADLVGEIESYQGPAIPVPAELSDYCENRTVTEIKVIEGWGARFSASGYMDCTPWCVFETEKEAQAYIDEQTEEDE
jgi:hypothetical protein